MSCTVAQWSALVALQPENPRFGSWSFRDLSAWSLHVPGTSTSSHCSKTR